MEQKSYRIKITFTDNSVKWIQATAKKIIAEKNVIYYVKARFKDVKKIEVRMYNENTKKYYTNLCYDIWLEHMRTTRTRIEATNPKGWEDYTGYGGRTNGLKNRFKIGRSTGWIPCYLEILTERSMGGGSLCLAKGKRILKPI